MEWSMPAIQIYGNAPVSRYASNRWLTQVCNCNPHYADKNLIY